MGNAVSIGRRYLIGSNNAENNNQLNIIINNDNFAASRANSRLNLINQLITFKGKKSKTNNLGDFTNVSFSSYIYLAGHKFKNLIDQAQTFLFGDQLDLAFILLHKPSTFSYDIANLNTPSNYLQSLINIRKDTLKLVKCLDEPSDLGSNEIKYNIEFVFDCDCDVIIRIYYFANESFLVDSSDHRANVLKYKCGCSKMQHLFQLAHSSNSTNDLKCICLNDPREYAVYKKGANIQFKQPKHFIIPSRFHPSVWQFNLHSNYYPIVIECRPINDDLKHAHVTLAYIEKSQAILNTPCALTTAMTSPTEVTTITNNDQGNMETSGAVGALKSISTDNGLNRKFKSVGCLSQINHSYQIKPIKQKQFIDGVLFSLQEIYGIEKKSSHDSDLLIEQEKTRHENEKTQATTESTQSAPTACTEQIEGDELVADELKSSEKQLNASRTSCSMLSTTTITTSSSTIEHHQQQVNSQFNEDNEHEQELKGIECVICMCEIRDTLILPCRHLCLCKLCAINLRVQSNNCPICRIPFIALIQLKLYKRKDKKKLGNEKPNQLTTEELKKVQLPIIKLEEISETNTEDVNGIIEIGNQVAFGEATKQVQVKSECKQHVKKSKLKHIMDFYECVTIYEAFNGANLQTVAQNTSECKGNEISIKTKKAKKPKSKRTSTHLQTQHVNDTLPQTTVVNETEIKKLSSIASSSKSVRSCSVLVNSSLYTKVSENADPIEKSNAKLSSKSAFDLRDASIADSNLQTSQPKNSKSNTNVSTK